MTTPHLWLAQLPLVCAILAEIDRQAPGAFVDDGMMDVIVRAANTLVETANAGGVFLPQEPTP